MRLVVHHSAGGRLEEKRRAGSRGDPRASLGSGCEVNVSFMSSFAHRETATECAFGFLVRFHGRVRRYVSQGGSGCAVVEVRKLEAGETPYNRYRPKARVHHCSLRMVANPLTSEKWQVSRVPSDRLGSRANAKRLCRPGSVLVKRPTCGTELETSRFDRGPQVAHLQRGLGRSGVERRRWRMQIRGRHCAPPQHRETHQI
jgi:hypothetical protein